MLCLTLHADESADCQGRQGSFNVGHKWKKGGKLVRVSIEQYHCYRQRRKVLLILQALVDGNEGIKLGSR